MYLYSEFLLIRHKSFYKNKLGGFNEFETLSASIINSFAKLTADKGVWWIKWWRINKNSLHSILLHSKYNTVEVEEGDHGDTKRKHKK